MSEPPIHTTHFAADGVQLAISRRTSPCRVEDLAGRTGHLMISIKNRLFNGGLIDAFGRFASTYLAQAYVTVVDTPYLHNVAAVTSDPAERQRRAASVLRLAGERTRHTRKILGRHDSTRIAFYSWDALADAVPRWLSEEIVAAFDRRGRFRAALARQSRRMVPGYATATNPDRFERFLLEETPVLLYVYYLFREGVVDFYPGEIGDYFWEIEQGVYADELPRTTRLAQGHRGLVYADFRLERGSAGSG